MQKAMYLIVFPFPSKLRDVLNLTSLLTFATGNNLCEATESICLLINTDTTNIHYSEAALIQRQAC